VYKRSVATFSAAQKFELFFFSLAFLADRYAVGIHFPGPASSLGPQEKMIQQIPGGMRFACGRAVLLA